MIWSLEFEDAFRKAVRAAGKRGGTREPRPGAMTAEDAIPGIGRDILFALGSRDPPKLGGRGVASPAATKKELAALAKAAKAMLAAIENLHAPAVTALDWHLPALWRMASGLRLLIVCEAQAVIPHIPPGSGLGKKPDAQARRVAHRTLEYFRRLIGEPKLAKPTKAREKVHSSAFLNLLTDVFEILGITGDPVHYAQWAIVDDKELTRKKSGQLAP